MAQRPRLRFSNRSVAVAVVVVTLALAALRLLAASTRVLGWVLVASIVGGLLHPIVAALSQKMPRPLAMVAVIVGLLVPIGALAYGSIDQLQSEARRLERVAPAAAERIEESERFGEAAIEFELSDRVRDLVDEIPERLRGGDTATALRSAATRGVAFLATGVLTLFMILHGPTLVTSGLAQIRDVRRRELTAAVLAAAFRRAWRYVMLTLGRVFAAGLFTFVVCEATDVPGSLLLAIWVAIFALLPLLGVLTGGMAVILLSVAVDLDSTAFIAAMFVAYQVFDIAMLQRPLEKRSVHVGPVVTLVAAMVGLEVYGIGGLLVSLVVAVFAVAVMVELSPGHDGRIALFELASGPDAGPDTPVTIDPIASPL
ncbi:MAG TPA: AI-2E family transporter [Acidimicrobiales bacterium]|nr:AI-2E family transporter [Acidimicrobiales bacterium]